eukprot:1238939-Alexandrium_andersonii.AAC.1
MARSPFGPDGVSARWPYLGGVVGTRAAVGVPPAGRWAPLEARRMREAGWAPPWPSPRSVWCMVRTGLPGAR